MSSLNGKTAKYADSTLHVSTAGPPESEERAQELVENVDPEGANVLTITHSNPESWLSKWRDAHSTFPSEQGFVLLGQMTRSATESGSPSTYLPGVSYLAVHDPADTAALLQTVNLYLDDWQSNSGTTIIVIETFHEILSKGDLDDTLYALHELIQRGRTSECEVHAIVDASELGSYQKMAVAPFFETVVPESGFHEITSQSNSDKPFFHLSEAACRDALCAVLNQVESTNDETIDVYEIVPELRRQESIQNHSDVNSSGDVHLFLRHVLLPKLQRLALLSYNDYNETITLLVDASYARDCLDRANDRFKRSSVISSQ